MIHISNGTTNISKAISQYLKLLRFIFLQKQRQLLLIDSAIPDSGRDSFCVG